MDAYWKKYTISDVDWSEHYIKKENPEAPTYYIIRRSAGKGAGLFSNYNVFAGHIMYALSRGYIPVIDMQNYPNSYLPSELLGKENAWEYYFEQPFRIGLKQAYSGENVLLGAGEPIISQHLNAVFDLNFYKNKNNMLTKFRMLVELGLLKIKPQLQKEIDETWESFFSPHDRVLGVKLRGTDFFIQKPYNHPIPPL